MIKVKGVFLTYPDGTTALNNIDLDIKPGQLVYITGPSGSGKTSLLKLFMGVEYPTEGTMKVLGQFIDRDNSENIRSLRRKIGPVFQDFRLVKGRTAMENVLLGMRFLDMAPGQLKENAANALSKVGLEHKMKSMVENLSWGETQRVAIARAVARKPSLILADEPTGNLDKDNALRILELLNSFRDQNTAVVITTHATHLIENDLSAVHIKMISGSMHMERQGMA